MKANQKLLNERARFVLYDEYKFRLQKPEENYMGFDPPVIMLESGFCSDESGCDQYCFIRMGVKGHFFVEVGPYRLLSFSGQIIEAKYNNPPSEIWKAYLVIVIGALNISAYILKNHIGPNLKCYLYDQSRIFRPAKLRTIRRRASNTERPKGSCGEPTNGT